MNLKPLIASTLLASTLSISNSAAGADTTAFLMHVKDRTEQIVSPQQKIATIMGAVNNILSGKGKTEMLIWNNKVSITISPYDSDEDGKRDSVIISVVNDAVASATKIYSESDSIDTGELLEVIEKIEQSDPTLVTQFTDIEPVLDILKKDPRFPKGKILDAYKSQNMLSLDLISSDGESVLKRVSFTLGTKGIRVQEIANVLFSNNQKTSTIKSI